MHLKKKIVLEYDPNEVKPRRRFSRLQIWFRNKKIYYRKLKHQSIRENKDV